MEEALVVKNLKKSYGAIEAVRGISFEVFPDEIFGLIGPNGAGKSTTLKMLATLLSPSGGSAEIYKQDILKNSEEVRSMISYLPEEAGAYKNMTGRAYLQFMASLFLNDKYSINEAVKLGIEIADLGERINDKINTYSKGMTRKLLLARSVMIKPKLAIMDEPTSGLDVVNALEIRNKIKKLAKMGMSVLLSSHNMLEVEFLSDRVAIIANGEIHEVGKPDELKKKYDAKNLEEVFVKLTVKK